MGFNTDELLMSDHWNHPSNVYSGMDKELAERRALVIAIQYFPPHMLWSTFSDAYNIVDMLVAGHGYTANPGERASGREGILPVTYEVFVGGRTPNDPEMKQIVDTDTVLFDRQRHTAGYNPITLVSKGIRGQIELGAQRPRGQATGEDYVPGLGNILDLPMKIDPGGVNNISLSERATLNPENRELKVFPPGCEVVCWYSSVPIRERQFTTVRHNYIVYMGHVAWSFSSRLSQKVLVQNGVFTYKDLYEYMR
ncbi:hypothetical protein FRC10_003850 [Ceratobasidium sp. 414]|nr:hypothetical protein FRC10_003850 [Ceratobasidium sp. 414]